MEVLAHHGRRVLELGLEPRRRVRESPLRRGEAVVGGAERLGKAPRDPPVRLPRFAPKYDQVLRGERARLQKVLLLDQAKVGEQADDRSRPWMVGLGPRRT